MTLRRRGAQLERVGANVLGRRPITARSAMKRSLVISILALVALGTGCTVKMGGAPPSNYDYSEYERYERPHAVSPTYAEQGYVPAASADAED